MTEEEAEKLKAEIREEMSEHFKRLKAEIDQMNDKLKEIGAAPLEYGSDIGPVYSAEVEARSVATKMKEDQAYEEGRIGQAPQI